MPYPRLVFEDKAYVCVHVLTAARPVLYVCREDDDLMFTCGGTDHEQSADDWKVLHARHLFDADPSLAEAASVAEGKQVERTAVGGPCICAPLEE